MKLSYYGYYINEVKSGKKYLIDMGAFFKAFCQFENPAYKNRFVHNGENVFLLHASGNLYLFLQTRSKELIKKINSTDITIADIQGALKQGEVLGFASFVYIKDSHLGFASTVMAPRVAAFSAFVNDVMGSVSLDKYQFVLAPLLHQATRAEAISMPFLGKATIQINKENSFWDDIRNSVKGEINEFSDVDSFEIVIKPKQKKDISGAVRKFLTQIPDAGVEKLVLRAREDLHGALTDLYLAGNGIVSDAISTKDERAIAAAIKGKIDANLVLKEKVAAHEQDECFESKNIASISKYSDVAAWSIAVSGV